MKTAFPEIQSTSLVGAGAPKFKSATHFKCYFHFFKIGVIEKLLADRTTLVVGSAVMAFEEVCPERIELIHKNYRKLCNLLVDVEEWGQVVIINMLSRYARTQFADPNAADELEEAMEAEKEFYSNSDESEEDEDGAESARKKADAARPKMDADHRLLLRDVHAESTSVFGSNSKTLGVMGVIQFW